MSKKILKLEKETHVWKTRWEKSNAALIEIAADKQLKDSEIVKLNKKCSLLHELCKAIQQERATLLSQLKQKNSNNDSEEISTQDNQEVQESSLIERINTKIKEQTKESKTEMNSANKKVAEVNISEPRNKNQDPNVDIKKKQNIDCENSENVNATTLNNENNQRLTDVASTEAVNIQIPIDHCDKASIQENSLNCMKEETTDQVPVEAKDPTQAEAAICNPEKLTEPVETSAEVTVPVVNSPNVTDSATESPLNNNIVEVSKETTKIIEEKKGEKHNVEKTNAVIQNGELGSNAVRNKKYKINLNTLIK